MKKVSKASSQCPSRNAMVGADGFASLAIGGIINLGKVARATFPKVGIPQIRIGIFGPPLS